MNRKSQVKLTSIEEYKLLVESTKKSKGQAKRRSRHVRGQMNTTEKKYADLLALRKHAGEVVNYEFEIDTLDLGERCTFTPDFRVTLRSGVIEYVDVKGGGPFEDDALVKVKWAAAKYPQFLFVIEQLQRKRDGGGFRRREFRRGG